MNNNQPPALREVDYLKGIAPKASIHTVSNTPFNHPTLIDRLRHMHQDVIP